MTIGQNQNNPDGHMDSPQQASMSLDARTGRVVVPMAAAGLVFILTVVALRYMGRNWWCDCGRLTLFVIDPNTAHNSQHLCDWYAFTHLLHGVIFFWALKWVIPQMAVSWKLLIAVTVESLWEVVENSPMVIDRYRTATAALGYQGDSLVNSIGDLLFCIVGFFLARTVGWRWSLVMFVVVELGLLWAIRDNLTLNVVMLLWPMEAIKQWQLAQ